MLQMIEFIKYHLSDENVSSAHIMLKGCIGAFVPILGASVSFVEHTEPWLRIISLCVGILVGLVTLFSLLLTIRVKIVEVRHKGEKKSLWVRKLKS